MSAFHLVGAGKQRRRHDYVRWQFCFGLRVKMHPQTTRAVIAAKKIPSCSCCIVVFSVA